MIHKCIKISCGNQYESDEIDAYYCESCIEKNKEIAAKINEKMRHTITIPIQSAMTRYDAAPKVRGMVRDSDFPL